MEEVLSRRSVVGLLLGSATFAAVGPRARAGAAPVAAPTSPPNGWNPDDALRRLDKPDLSFEELTTLTGRNHRVTFHRATWQGGAAVVRDLALKVDGDWLPVTGDDDRFDEQWALLTGTTDSIVSDYWNLLEPHWIAFTGFRQLSDQMVELRSELEGVATVQVRWDLSGDQPELHQRITAHRDDDFVLAHTGLADMTLDEVDEVLCGARQHAKYVQPDSFGLAAWELFAPMALVQRTIGDTSLTMGHFIPSDALEFLHERNIGKAEQPFAMSLRNDTGELNPSSFVPAIGERTPLAAGESRGFLSGLYLGAHDLTDAYEDLARGEYGLTAYRSNVYGSSLTDAAHNLADLLMIEPEADDSVDFVPSQSGWWNRAKGIIDVENDQAVRISGTAVLLAAHRILGADMAMYHRRARPTLEYGVSRTGVGHTPIEGKTVYGDPDQFRITGVSRGRVGLGALHALSGQANGALVQLSHELTEAGDSIFATLPSTLPLAMWLLTGDPSYRTEARLAVDRYLTAQVLTPYETNSGETGFGFGYSKRWTDLLRWYELATDDEIHPDLLRGIALEARRFISQANLRPVPDGEITVPSGEDLTLQYDWPDGALADYPLSEVPTETVPQWQVSTSGLTVEQLSTYKGGGGFTNNAIWSSFLLRLSSRADDPLLGDVAHNQVIGRYNTYPGYYNKQFQTHQQKPDYALTGPIEFTGFWYHHIPGQLLMTINHLLSEAYAKSGGEIDFPRFFEANHAYFDFDLYGHRPGRFHGEDGVWPWFPKGLLSQDNPMVNWISGVGNGHLYVALTNTSGRPQRATVALGPDLSGSTDNPTVDVLGGEPLGRLVTTDGGFSVTVPAHGQVAVAVREVTGSAPWQVEPEIAQRGQESFHSTDLDPDGDEGALRGMLLVRPDGSGHDAYVQIDTTAQATLRYRIGDGGEQVIDDKPYPNEWTIGVDDPAQPFTYRVTTADWDSGEITLQLPVSLQPAADRVDVQIVGHASATPGAEAEVSLWLRNGTDDPIEDVEPSLGLPQGWTLRWDDAPTTLAAGEQQTVVGTVTVSQDSPTGRYELTGALTWDGGTAEAHPYPFMIRDPRAILSFSADPAVIAHPGDSTTLTVRIVNAGAVPITSEIAIWGQPGWTVEGGRTSLTLEAAAETVHSVAVHSPATADPGTANQFRVSVDDGELSTTAQIRVADAGQIITNETPAPAYRQTGSWLRSSLPGYQGIRSRYSAPEEIGGTATFEATIAEDSEFGPGEYRISVWYPSNAETTTEARYVVQHADGEDTVVRSQRSGANTWTDLGTWTLAPGKASVTLHVDNTDFHRTSACRFLPLE